MSTTAHNILLTGAGSGLGRGLSLDLAQQGHTCLVTDQNLAAAQETAALVTAAGGRATAHALDVTAERDIERLLETLDRTRVDV
jgi:3-hydroxybutyrate dehydrogenase